jgi:hypothetical protein
MHRRHRGRDTAEAGDQDDRQAGDPPMQLGEQFVALHVGHHDVRDNQVRGAALKGGQRLASVVADFDFARRVAQGLLEQALINRIVFND